MNDDVFAGGMYLIGGLAGVVATGLNGPALGLIAVLLGAGLVTWV